MDNGQIILFQAQGGETKIEVQLANETVWLTTEFHECTQYQLSPIEIYFPETFEAEQRRLHAKK